MTAPPEPNAAGPNAAGPNAAERRRWNNAYWSSVWPKRERLTDAVTPILLSHLGLTDGDRVLDVGSGGGRTTLAVAQLVGSGSVVGADISVPMVELARQRTADAEASNVSYFLGDLQHDTVPDGPFQAALSQFGVMFFDEPVTAFANIRRQLVSGGPLAFACWRPAAENPWHIGATLAPFMPAAPPLAPGKSRTGPFAFGDPEHVRGLLTASGWNAVERTSYDLAVTVERDAIDAEQNTFDGLPAESLDAARVAVDEHVESLRDAAGQIVAPLAIQVFTARA